MAPVLRIAADPALADSIHVIERSVSVRTAAIVLDVDDSTIRKLVKKCELEGHRVGSRGIRIYERSIAAYRAARAIGGAPAAPSSPPKRQPQSAAHREALATLRQMGIV